MRGKKKKKILFFFGFFVGKLSILGGFLCGDLRLQL